MVKGTLPNPRFSPNQIRHNQSRQVAWKRIEKLITLVTVLWKLIDFLYSIVVRLIGGMGR